MAATIRYHEGDISAADAARYLGAIAIDTETLGLVPRRDRLCVVQLSHGDGTADVIRIAAGQKEAPNLTHMLADPARQKIFHYGRFDIAVLFHTFGVTTTPVFCTKIASRLTRTYTDRHGLKDNLKEMLEVDISKAQQSSDWAAENCHPHSSNMPHPMCCICMRCATKLTTASCVMVASIMPMPVSRFCRPVPSSIFWAGTKRISSPIAERFHASFKD